MFDIDEIIAKLLSRFDSFGKIIASVKIIEDSSIDTANTNGKVIRYNPNFMGSLTPEQAVFVLAHEILHIELEHIKRSKGRNHRVWNIASDAINNAYLVKAGLPMIEGGVDIPEAVEYDCEELYDLMMRIQDEIDEGRSKGNGNNSNSNNNRGENADTEGKSSNEREPGNEGDDNKESIEEKIRKQLLSTPEGSTSYGVDSHEEWEKVEQEVELDGDSSSNDESGKISEKEYFENLDKERKESAKNFAKQLFNQATSKGVKSYGNLTNSTVRLIERPQSYGHLIPWRDVLKESLQVEEVYSRKIPRVRYGVFKYRMREEPIKEVEIVLDTSASISNNLLVNFLKECKSIIKDSSKVRVGCFDTKFYGFTEIKKISDIDLLEFKGGGCTDFDAAVNAFTQNAAHKIIFTDGEAEMPEKKVDAIWVVIGDKKINPPGGKVINISKEELIKLKGQSIITTEDFVP